MRLFARKCLYCGEKIARGEEVESFVKIPEFTDKVKRFFCCESHLELYDKNVKGTPSRNSCPYCVN